MNNRAGGEEGLGWWLAALAAGAALMLGTWRLAGWLRSLEGTLQW